MLLKKKLLFPFLCISWFSSQAVQSHLVLSVDDFGAVGDGITNNTQAFLSAWNTACFSGVSTALHVPAGKVYLVSPLDFIGPCKRKQRLYILGRIVAPSNPGAWVGHDPNKWLYFRGVDKLTVRGGGTIDGMGQEWWAQSCKTNASNPCRIAPKSVTFDQCTHVTVKDLALINSQQFHISFSMCKHVKAYFLKVIAPANSPNTDGIHISNSSFVKVRDNTISTGDDCISIVGNSSSIRVRNILCGPGHGISIGSLGKSGSDDRIYNVKVDICSILNTQNGVRIKTWQGGRGYARKIVFENIFMKNVSNPIIIDQYYCDSPVPCQNATRAVKVDEVSYINIKGTSASKVAVKFACSDSYPCRKLFVKDVQLSLESGGEAAAYCWKARGSSCGSVYPPPCFSSSDHFIMKQYTSKSKIPLRMLNIFNAALV